MFVLFFLIAIYISGSLRNYDHLLLMKVFTVNKQIFHAFLFNIRNYSPEVINIQRRKTELNITLPTVNNFDIKQKKGMEYLFYYMPPTPNNIWEDID